MSKKITHTPIFNWMVHIVLDSLITSKTRIKLLLKFFANPGMSAYLRSLAEEFGESTNSVRVELNRLTEANLLTACDEGRTKIYRANPKHPLFNEVQSMVRKYMGIDQLSGLIFEKIAALGNVEKAYLVGDYAQGLDEGCIEIVVVGNVDEKALEELVNKAEAIVRRDIRVQIIFSESHLDKQQPNILIWDKNNQ